MLGTMRARLGFIRQSLVLKASIVSKMVGAACNFSIESKSGTPNGVIRMGVIPLVNSKADSTSISLGFFLPNETTNYKYSVHISLSWTGRDLSSILGDGGKSLIEGIFTMAGQKLSVATALLLRITLNSKAVFIVE